MAFSFATEMLNMWMRKREKAKNPVFLREPQLPEKISPEKMYDDSAH
jgi:hypothetical protein